MVRILLTTSHIEIKSIPSTFLRILCIFNCFISIRVYCTSLLYNVTFDGININISIYFIVERWYFVSNKHQPNATGTHRICQITATRRSIFVAIDCSAYTRYIYNVKVTVIIIFRLCCILHVMTVTSYTHRFWKGLWLPRSYCVKIISNQFEFYRPFAIIFAIGKFDVV